MNTEITSASDEIEELKKKLKDRVAMYFVAYIKETREREELLRKEDARRLERDFYLSFAKAAFKKTEAALEEVRHHDESVEASFEECEKEEPPEKLQERETRLKTLGMEKKTYHTIALASAFRDRSSAACAAQVMSGKTVDDRTRQLQKEGLNQADEALDALQKGNYTKLETILKEGLKTACSEFVRSTDTVTSMHWARHVGNLTGVAVRNPELFADASGRKLLETAMGIASMGKVLEDGYEALMSFQKGIIDGKAFTREEMLLLEGKIMLMHQVEDRKKSREFLELFAGNGDAERVNPEQNIKNALDHLASSALLQELIELPKGELCVALSDPSARSIISENSLSLYPASAKKLSTGTVLNDTKSCQRGRF